jgi:(p)ppGpp synthase/HD superfamily hydrolase
MIAAAWLHDVVEDTPVTIAEIEAEFGLNIARLVDDLTDVSRKSDGSRRQRLAIDREHTARAEPRAKTIKLADVIDNLSDIVNQNSDFAPKYLSEKEELLEVLVDGHPVLMARAQTVIQEQWAALERLRSEM